MIDDRTRAVVISHVDFNSGYRNDLAAMGVLAHARGALFVVDASQSLGAIPVDVTTWGIDALVCVGYKWLMGVHGISVLYVSESVQEAIGQPRPGGIACDPVGRSLNTTSTGPRARSAIRVAR